MATVVRMPAALAGATEGAVQSWLAHAGQTIAVGDPLAEIETEKAVVEYAAEVDGTVARLLAEPGENVAVGAPIAVILAPGETEDAARTALAAAGIGQAEAGAAPDPSVTETPAPPEPETAAEPPTPPSSPADAAGTPAASHDTAPPPPSSPSSPGRGRIFASPLVRRLAHERGLALETLTGSGPGGRIVRRDIDSAPAATAPEVPEAAVASVAAPAASSPPASVSESFDAVPLTGMRRAIARRLTESKTTVPHFYLTAHCRVDALLELRARVNADLERKVSVNDFVLKAVAGALRRVPAANAIWGDDVIRRFDRADLAVAVAVEDGLLTPVIRSVDTLTLSQVAATVAELADRARSGRLRQHELEGGSFSVSNLGMYGVDEFSAILNPPQSGILAVGAAKQRPVVTEGALAVATVMTVTLSADHRVIDGAVAAEWMAAFVSLIENPVLILV